MEAAENKDTGSVKPEEEAAGTEERETPKPAGLKGTRSLRKLRDRVERAAHELIRLREENAALKQRIEELEAAPVNNSDDGILLWDSDPDALKRKVEGFIQSIDNYLESNGPSE